MCGGAFKRKLTVITQNRQIKLTARPHSSAALQHNTTYAYSFLLPENVAHCTHVVLNCIYTDTFIVHRLKTYNGTTNWIKSLADKTLIYCLRIMCSIYS